MIRKEGASFLLSTDHSPLLLGIGIIVLDQTTWGIFSPIERHALLLMSVIPLAAKSVAYATELKTEPEKASLAVLLSTLFAWGFIPAVLSFF